MLNSSFIFNISLSKLSFIFLNTEAPEQAYDPRTLYERLKEQKDKKQEEYEGYSLKENYMTMLYAVLDRQALDAQTPLVSRRSSSLRL